MTNETSNVLVDVAGERDAQDEKWGVQEHAFTVWLTILTEEVGEVARAALEYRFEPGPSTSTARRIREELVQTAAVAVAAIEDLDRKWPSAKKNRSAA